jgi:hypothetical protein
MLQSIAPPFPPGSIVSLSDQTRAVVVDIDPTKPYRPTVKRIIGDDMQLDETRIDLKRPDMPAITHIGRTEAAALIPTELCEVS